MTPEQELDALWAEITARRLARQIEDEERHGPSDFNLNAEGYFAND